MNIFHEQQFRFAARTNGDQLLVSDVSSNTVFRARKGGGVFGKEIHADFKQPEDIAVDGNGDVFVVDRYNGCVKVFSYDSAQHEYQLQRVIGEGALNQPVGITLAKDKGETEVYVADNENHRLAVFRPDGHFVRAVGGGYGQAGGQLFCPCGVAVYKGFAIVAEWGNGRVQVFDKGGKSVLVANGFPHAHHVAVDGEGVVYVALYSHKQIRKLKISVYEDGTPSFVVGEEALDLSFHPTGVYVEGEGKIGVVGKTKVEVVAF